MSAEAASQEQQPFTMADFERFVGKYVWRFAHTMPHIPHWHLAASRAFDRSEFQRAAMFIRSQGRPVKFGTRTFTYLRCGEYDYWTMPPDLDWAITIINRAKPKD